MKSILLVLSLLFNVLASNDTIVPFFPGCYKDDDVQHSLDIGIIIDFGTYTQVVNSGKLINDEIEYVISTAKVVYKQQFNIVLKINKIIIGDENSPLPLSRSNYLNTCTNAIGAFNEIGMWNKYQNQTGYWMLLSNCFSRITGVSYVGSVCGDSNGGVSRFDWLDFAHELGHGIGSSHTFRNGGIMDYTNGKYNGIVQYYPGSKDQICPFLNHLSVSCPKYFKKMAGTQECGDGILSGTETCECLDGSKKCGTKKSGCINCQTIQKCSSVDFIMRNKDSVVVSVNKNELADPKCCINGSYFAKTLCSNNIDVCTKYGRCSKVCSKALGPRSKVCGFEEGGCMQGCIYNDNCRYDLSQPGVSGTVKFISTVDDNTQCILDNKPGTCLSGKCILDPIVVDPVVCKNIKNKKNCIFNKCKWYSRKCHKSPR